MQSDHQFHVLAEGVVAITADADYGLLVKEAERTGNDQHAVELRPAESAEQEGAQILDDLDHGDRIAGQAGAHQETMADVAAVGDPDGATDRDGVGIGQKRQDDPRQTVALQDRIGIDAGEQRITSDVDQAVEGIGLAAVGLVQHLEIAIATRPIDRLDRLGGQAVSIGFGVGVQLEFTDQRVERAIPRAIIGNQDFVIGVVDLQQCPHRSGDRRFLVVGRHQQADRRVQMGLDLDQRLVLVQPQTGQHIDRRRGIEQQVDAVQGQKIGQEHDFRCGYYGLQHHRSASRSASA